MAQTVVADDSDASFTILAQMVTVISPNGGENWNGGSAHNITWSADASITNVNIDYSINSGNSWTPVAANIANAGTYAWTVPATTSTACLVRVSAAGNAGNNDFSDRVFSISSSSTETVTAPSKPSGPDVGSTYVLYSFSSGGASSNFGDAVQYRFDWGDGSDSGWLAVGTTSASHYWTASGTFQVRAKARCSVHTTVESSWSEAHGIVISLATVPSMMWNTFMGGGTGLAISDLEEDVTTDGAGNIYVVGSSNATWGSPLTPYHGGTDTFVAKLNSSGVLQWMTFLGGSSTDVGVDITVDGSGNIFITGYSSAAWGNPIASYSGGYDAFVAKLNGSGILQWNTFMGGTSWDAGLGIALGSNGSIFITGFSNNSWGYPINPFGTGANAFLAKLNNSGTLQWNTFFYGNSGDFSKHEIAIDGSGNIIVAGETSVSWGTPINPFSGTGYNAIVVKFKDNGDRLWHTYMGGNGSVYSGHVALDGSGNIYITGYSSADWGNPKDPFTSGGNDAFTAKLDANGIYQWHTFMGGSGDDYGRGISVDVNGDVFVTGYSAATWGSPLNPYSGGSDGFIAKLNSEGVRQYNTFFGSSNSEDAKGIALDGCGNSIVMGKSYATWGNPVHPYSGNIHGDAFVAKFGLGTECIAVTSPNGGENWITGENHAVTWCTSGTTTQVDIDYSTNSGGNWTSLVSQITNSGSYSWTIPDTPSANCLVRVSNSANPTLSDQSNSVFTIAPYVSPSISVTSPNGGEDWGVWEYHDITWTSAGAVGNVSIDYSIDNGNNWIEVFADLTNSGSFTWNVPDTTSTSCLVRVRDAANSSVSDVSDATFTISALKTITVTSPNGGENWAAGSSHNITWTTSGTIANVNIDYSIDTGLNWISVAAGIANSGSYSWNVPANPSTTCFVRVSEAANPNNSDSNDQPFTISILPTITVISPNGGEQWQRGTTQVITWTSSNVTNVKIELLKGSSVNLTIASSTPAASGSYSWTIPSSQAVATNYKIRITSTASSSVTDSSNANFSIFAPAITVTAPAAGNSWKRGTTHTITWTASGTMDANVMIQLIKGSSVNSTISSSTSNDGSYDWTIPSGQATGSNYKVRVKTVDGLVSGDSGTFSITNTGSLALLSPNDRERLRASGAFRIRWSSDTAINEVKLEYSRDNGGAYLPIADHVPNTGVFDWKVPVNFTLNGIVRVSDNYGKNWFNEDGVLESTINFSCVSSGDSKQPYMSVWFGGVNVKSPGYGFARVSIGPEAVQMAYVSQAIAPLSSSWHEVKIRLDLKRDLGTLFVDGKLILENVALYTSKMYHFEPYLSIRAGGSAETDLLLGVLKFQVVLFNADGSEQDRFTVLNEDFSGYDCRRNVIGSCWLISGLGLDKTALEFKKLPGTGQVLHVQTKDGMPITICKPLAIPEKVPFDISDHCFSIEMRQGEK